MKTQAGTRISIKQFEKQLQKIFHQDIQQLAQQHAYQKRTPKKLPGHIFAQTLILGWMAHPQSSLTELCSVTAQLHQGVSEAGLHQRFTLSSARMLQGLFETATHMVLKAEQSRFQAITQHFSGVYLTDSSIITLPDVLQGYFEGCSGRCAKNTQSSLKLHARYEVLRGSLQWHTSSGVVHDQQGSRALTPLPPRALHLADLGYFALQDLMDVQARGVYFLSRLKASTGVYHPDGQPLDLVKVLAQSKSDALRLEVRLGTSKHVHCTLLAVRLPPEEARMRRIKLLKEAQREGQRCSARRLALADWNVWVTNLPAQLCTTPWVSALSKLRWQVELLFKWLKSLFQVDAWRTRNPYRVWCEVFAKLIGALLTHWTLVWTGWGHPRRSVWKATQVLFRFVSLWVWVLQGKLPLGVLLEECSRVFASCAFLSRRSGRKSTFQLLESLP